MKYGYIWVSIKQQELDVQQEQLRRMGCEIIYCETMSCSKIVRQEFQKLLSEIQSGDTLVVTKLNSLGRSIREALSIIEALFQKGININILNLGIIEDTPTGKLILITCSAFADFEACLTSERMAEGKFLARKRPGYKEGRPKKYADDQLDLAMKELKEHSYSQVAKSTGISKSTLVRYRRKQV